MLNRFKYKDWNFVEYINPKLEDSWSPDNVYQSGTYDGIYKSKSNDDEARVFERIMDWFKHIESDEETVFDSDEVWDSLAERERVKWFKGSRHMFISWWDKLPSKLKYYYTDRLISNKPLLPDRALFNETPNITEGVQVTIIDNKLAITSNKLVVLDNIKSLIEDLHGWVSYEHRTKALSMGRQMHTYIFDLKNR